MSISCARGYTLGCFVPITLLLVIPPDSISLAVTSEVDPGRKCLSDIQLRCLEGGECLSRTQWCNFWPDCEGGEDEERCGSSCDFDTKWPYEDKPCSAWNLSVDNDGEPGFRVVDGMDVVGVTESENFVTNGPPKSVQGHYALFVNQDHEYQSNATLGSPWFGSSGQQCHVNFAVNIQGTNVGHLELHLLTGSGIDRQVWSSHTDKGSSWLTYSVPFGAIREPFRFEFRVTRGIGDDGHFALDDIFLDNCSQNLPMQRECHLQEFMCNTSVCIPRSKVCDLNRDCLNGEDEDDNLCGDVNEGAACDFEEGLCGWTNISGDRLHWVRHSGRTPTDHTGPSKDHTLGSPTGHYVYYEASGGHIGDRATIVSRVFPIPPACTWDPDSPYFNSCQVRFFYHMYGTHVHQLRMHITEINIDGKPEDPGLLYENYWTKVIPSNNRGVNAWLRVSVPVPKVSRRFMLMFEGIRGLRFLGDIALDDVTLSPECFGKGILLGTSSSFETITEVVNKSTRFSFKTCANSGPIGPTQHQCDTAYKFTDKKVTVLTADDRLAGVQVWTLPESHMYSITALGASGGTGVGNPERSKGAYVHAKFNLTAGSKIYMLVGQNGESACSQTNKKNPQTSRICRHGETAQSPLEGRIRKLVGVGGGGGGGTYIFKYDPVTKNITMMIIAGGGGGKAYHLGYDSIRANGGLSIGGPGISSISPRGGPGAGGGLRGITNHSQAGQSLAEGGKGGKPCPKAQHPFDWEISGGFGGGGGACSAGGGGGGYSGGNVSQTDNQEHNGQGGSSYTSPDAIDPIFEPGTHNEDGEVEIAFVLNCPCEFMCIYQNYQEKKFKCYCAPNLVLDDDGLHCVDPRALSSSSKLPVVRLGAAVFGGFVVLIIIIVLTIYIVHRFNKKKLEAVRLDMLRSPDYQLDRLRSNAGTPGLLTAYNPNYDFGGSKCTLQDLREIQRDHLTLIRALGQGAFGEVYQGFLSHVQRDTSDLPVAVKTLPALCTNQAEMDFLMEALIMSKFNHSNIVRFIGVCFEKHPRFILLELLEGGDLKSFLRESRPKPRQSSHVTMVDLIELSLDVAQGCLYLEENHFIHRDIAARNCLLTKKGSGRVAKIADFGMARDIYRADYYRKGGKAMLPVKWMPPEAFLDGIFTLKTDIWSFGILLWEVFSLGYMPYPGRGNQEVMQLVTAGGRLDTPKDCPSSVYHIMGLCWHGIPERRPNFSTIIDKLQTCLQDPSVIHAQLPVFHRPPSVERDTTVMRPRDPDRMVLTVEPPKKYVEPDSPNSLMQLIGPQSPDYKDVTTDTSVLQLKKVNGKGSAESLDKLLIHDEKQTGNVFKYDTFISDACLPQPAGITSQFDTSNDEACQKCSQQAGDRVSADGASQGNDSGSELCSGSPGRVNTLDSGKGSLDSFPRDTGSASPRLPLDGRGKYAPGDSSTLPGSIARSRPSPKQPVTEQSSLLSLDKSHPRQQTFHTGDMLATTSSPSLDMADDGASEKLLYVNVPMHKGSLDTHRTNQWLGDSNLGDAAVTSASDPGDSGVVVELRGNAPTRLHAGKTDG